MCIFIFRIIVVYCGINNMVYYPITVSIHMHVSVGWRRLNHLMKLDITFRRLMVQVVLFSVVVVVVVALWSTCH